MDKEKKSFRPDGMVARQDSVSDSPTTNQTPTPEEGVVDQKDEQQSFEDYNGNSEANAPARAREE